VYTLAEYGEMVADDARMEAYMRALRQVVTPTTVVVDIGTGTGVFAMAACQLGARCVYAIEPTDAIQVAQEIATANGYMDRIRFIQDISTQVHLPQRADVIISDLRGVLPLFQQNLPSIIDARRRFLAPGGSLIPQDDRLWAALVEAHDLYGDLLTAWEENGYGFKMEPARRYALNTLSRTHLKPTQMLVEPKCWATLDYSKIEDHDISAQVSWTALQSGTAHGLCVWFDTVLVNGIGFSNAPDVPQLIYGSNFFPWERPVHLAIGDTVSVTLQAKLVGDEYIWRWDSRVLDQRQPAQVKADFKQSTFFGAIISPSRLRKQAGSYIPRLKENGQIDQFILTLMDGETSLDKIARQVSNRFPTRFARWRDALTRVGEVSQMYSQ
jgi:protein arginine N-methyltransferase 1